MGGAQKRAFLVDAAVTRTPLPRAPSQGALDELDWLDAPPAGTVQSAELLLDRIGASGGMEQRLARFPLSVALITICRRFLSISVV
jgi:hypothetical protein